MKKLAVQLIDSALFSLLILYSAILPGLTLMGWVIYLVAEYCERVVF